MQSRLRTFLKNTSMTGNSNRRQSGFTLVEVLISTTIISIVMVLASNLLLLFFRSQDTSRNTLYLEAEIRQIVSRIVETSREARIDYDFYGGGAPIDQPEFLAFRTATGVQTVYWFYTGTSTTDMYVCANKPIDETCSVPADPSVSADWARMNDTQTSFLVGSFFVGPDSDPYPFSGTPTTDQTPGVVMSFQMELVGTSAESPVVQTTVTPRIYAR